MSQGQTSDLSAAASVVISLEREQDHRRDEDAKSYRDSKSESTSSYTTDQEEEKNNQAATFGAVEHFMQTFPAPRSSHGLCRLRLCLCTLVYLSFVFLATLMLCLCILSLEVNFLFDSTICPVLSSIVNHC